MMVAQGLGQPHATAQNLAILVAMLVAGGAAIALGIALLKKKDTSATASRRLTLLGAILLFLVAGSVLTFAFVYGSCILGFA